MIVFTILLLLTFLAGIQVFTIFYQIVAGRFQDTTGLTIDLTRFDEIAAQISILIPAHNEEEGIEATLSSIKMYLGAEVDILVVAHNCTDRTADIVDRCGARCVKLNDRSLIGKGFALDAGVKNLRNNPPLAVLIIDADCKIADSCSKGMIVNAIEENSIKQAWYQMLVSNETSISGRFNALAWRLRCPGRLLGLAKHNRPCQLLGSGMALPWSILEQCQTGDGHLVEDMYMGIDCAKKGDFSYFYPSAKIISYFPGENEIQTLQKRRWVQGHIALIVKEFPSLVFQAVKSLNFRLLIFALDLFVLPLALLGILLLFLLATSLLTALVSSSYWIVFYLLLMEVLLLTAAVMLTWYWYGRDLLSLRDFAYLPILLIKKMHFFVMLIVRPANSWIRTKR